MTDITTRDYSAIPCTRCLKVGGLRVELRRTLRAKSLESYSLAGTTPKVTVIYTMWPWMVCNFCDSESIGKEA